MPTFPDILKYLRKRENVTQIELAKAIGLKGSTISMYEQGRREPDFEIQEKLADYFNVDLDFLMGRSVRALQEPDRVALREAFGPAGVMLVKKNPTPADIEFLNQLNQLAPENKAKIRELINLYLQSQNKDNEKK